MDRTIASHRVTGSTLKLVALFTMLIDHFAATVILQIANTGTGGKTLIDIYWVMRSIGRMAFPVYCFLLVEGFKYTHSRLRYAARLFIFALISEIPFDLALNNAVLEYKSNNVFFTLFLGLLTIIVLDWMKSADRIEKTSTLRWLVATFVKCIVMISVVLVMMIIAEFIICCDYGAAGVGCIVIMCLLQSNRELAFGAAVILLGLFSGSIEFFALFMLLLVHFYNGKRGLPLKYLFYAFYPAHLLILHLCCVLIG